MSRKTSKWQGHEGLHLASHKGFDVINCKVCGFKHSIPIPTDDELTEVYQHDYYTEEKPLFLERHKEDLEWWETVFEKRYRILEQYIESSSKHILDIGSGPGFFLEHGMKRGWSVKGIEPSIQAFQHSIDLGVDVDNVFFSEKTALKLEQYDVIHMSEVLEHIPDPKALLTLVNKQLNDKGLVCITVPNDFNPFQLILRDHLGFKPWWVGPPHHINYFDFDSLQSLMEKCGFEIVYKESTFPIDIFLLMGDDYIGNDKLGRICHTKRMNFEKNMQQSGMGHILDEMYSAFANQGLGREVVLIGRKVG